MEMSGGESTSKTSRPKVYNDEEAVETSQAKRRVGLAE